MHHETHTSKKFFETYQTFISIIIAGCIIAGAVYLSKSAPSSYQNSLDHQPQVVQNNQNPELQNQGPTEPQVRASLIETAKSLSLDGNALGTCLDKKIEEPLITAASNLASKSGVQGTPTFFILKRTFGPDDKLVSEKQIPIIGARDEATFIKAIESGTAPADQPALTGDKVVLTDSDHYMGPRRASIVIVEYSDIECPFCKRAKPIVDSILKNHPEYAFVYRHSPLIQLHPYAAYKAQATECAFAQGGEAAFWKFLDTVAR